MVSMNRPKMESRPYEFLLQYILSQYTAYIVFNKGFPGGSGKESACDAGGLGLIPRLGRSAGERNGNSLQHSCLGILMDRGAWWATVPGVPKSQTRLSD